MIYLELGFYTFTSCCVAYTVAHVVIYLSNLLDSRHDR